jgi:hypothetical protein
LRGYYVFDDGENRQIFENIITDDGKGLIAKYLAGLISNYAGAIAVGAGKTVATVSDKSLEYEFARVPIAVRNVTGPSAGIYQVSFKGTLPSQLEGVITESGIVSQTFNRYAGSYGDKLLAWFDSNENWTVSSSTGMSSEFEMLGYESNYSVKVGGEGLRVYSTAGGTHNLTLESTVVGGDFSGYSSADQFGLAMSGKIVPSGTTIQLRFYSDATNYWTGTLTPTVNNADSWVYEILKISKSQLSQNGTPDWSDIVKAQAIITTPGTTTNLILDSLSAFDTDYINPDYAVVSRASSSTPVIKTAGKSMDVEYFLEFRL